MAGALARQAHPDFSGSWTRASDPAGRPPDPGSGWGDDITLRQDADSLVLEHAFFVRGDMQPPLRFAFALDGSPSTGTVMMGRGIQREVSRVRWDGDTLVVTTTYHYPDAVVGEPDSSEVVRRLTLGPQRSLVVETLRAGVMGGPSATTRTEYLRSARQGIPNHLRSPAGRAPACPTNRSRP